MASDVVLCAVPLEFKALCEAAGAKASEFTGRRFIAEIAPGWSAMQIGFGKALAAAGAEAAIAHFQPKRVLEFGGAGALDLSLNVGQVIMADQTVEHDAFGFDGKNPRFPLKRFFAFDNAITGSVACGDQVVSSTVERSALRSRVNASAVTMETSAIARVCRIHGVEFASFRVITDRGENQDVMAEFLAGAAKSLRPAAETLLRFLKNPKST